MLRWKLKGKLWCRAGRWWLALWNEFISLLTRSTKLHWWISCVVFKCSLKLLRSFCSSALRETTKQNRYAKSNVFASFLFFAFYRRFCFVDVYRISSDKSLFCCLERTTNYRNLVFLPMVFLFVRNDEKLHESEMRFTAYLVVQSNFRLRAFRPSRGCVSVCKYFHCKKS